MGLKLGKKLRLTQAIGSEIDVKLRMLLSKTLASLRGKLHGYDKIVVFLSNIYRKYDPILKIMKSKLGGRM